MTISVTQGRAVGKDGSPLGRFYEVSGRRLLLRRDGHGGPAVIFLPGAGLIGADFLNVQQATAAFTTSLLYDRAGTGFSDDVDLPRTPTEVAEELHALLNAAEVDGPYILAGHSLGAFYARRFAQLFPGEVAAILLLDPGHEDIHSYMPPEALAMNEQLKALDPATMPDLTEEQKQAGRGQCALLYEQWPQEILDLLVEQKLEKWRTQMYEVKNFETDVFDELRAGGPLPDVPLIILSALGQNLAWAQYGSPEMVRQAQEGVVAMHDMLANSVARGERRGVVGASHQYMHIEKPDAVVEAIRDVVERARGK